MFHRHKLTEDGAQAQAVVTVAKRSGGIPTDEGMSPVTYHLTLDVHFDDGSTAAAECKIGGMLRGTDLSFYEGDIVPVRYDPADRSKIEIDEQAIRVKRDADAAALKQESIERAERQLAGIPEPDLARPAPGDAEMLAAHQAWRAANTKAKAARREQQRAQAAGVDKREAFRLLDQSTRLSAAAKSAQGKFNDLHKRRPDWTAPAD